MRYLLPLTWLLIIICVWTLNNSPLPSNLPSSFLSTLYLHKQTCHPQPDLLPPTLIYSHPPWLPFIHLNLLSPTFTYFHPPLLIITHPIGTSPGQNEEHSADPYTQGLSLEPCLHWHRWPTHSGTVNKITVLSIILLKEVFISFSAC